jgi:hypothetical protein
MSHLSLFTPVKNLRYPLNRRLGGPQSPSGRFEEKPGYFPLPGFEIRTVEPVAGPYT